ncbi:MAG: hypothetical protein IKV98_07930 [Clostridia bacterium]|nr:hypothetical protein [Clostridia bacterium]
MAPDTGPAAIILFYKIFANALKTGHFFAKSACQEIIEARQDHALFGEFSAYFRAENTKKTHKKSKKGRKNAFVTEIEYHTTHFLSSARGFCAPYLPCPFARRLSLLFFTKECSMFFISEKSCTNSKFTI